MQTIINSISQKRPLRKTSSFAKTLITFLGINFITNCINNQDKYKTTLLSFTDDSEALCCKGTRSFQISELSC